MKHYSFYKQNVFDHYLIIIIFIIIVVVTIIMLETYSLHKLFNLGDPLSVFRNLVAFMQGFPDSLGSHSKLKKKIIAFDG